MVEQFISVLDGINKAAEAVGKSNFEATAAPDADNDNTEGYIVGSLWFDTNNSKLYIADSVGTGTATWVDLTESVAGTYVPLSQKGAANGVATLDGSSKIPTAQLPLLALSEVFVAADQTAQLALTAQEGDVAVRTDQNKSYIHNGGSAGDMTDWQELLTPTDAVLSVNGNTGAVTLGFADLDDASFSGVASGNVIYYNGANWVNASLATAGIAAASHNHATSDITSGTFADARIAESNVTQHESALTILKSQITEFGQKTVEAKTSSYNVTAADSGKIFTNAGAGVEVPFNLPTAAAGLVYEFTVAAAQYLKVVANTGDKIKSMGADSKLAGYIRANEVDKHLRIEAVDSTNWVVTDMQGSWLVETA